MNPPPTSAQRFLRNELLRLPLSAMLITVVILASCPEAHASQSIKRAEYVSANGTKLYLLIRGADRAAPVLLWLHGGPGGAERPLFRYFNGDLEQHFVVVYWDQRGAGRSFDAKADPHSLTIAQHLADLEVVVNHLRKSLGQDKVIVIGHSWGAALGLLYAHAYPDKVAAFIAVNPLISTRESQQAQYDFVLAQATQRHDGKTLARLREIGTPPYQKASQVLAMEKVAQRYGVIFHTEPNRAGVMFGAVFSGLVTPWEIQRLIHANTVSLEAMNEELLGLDLRRSVPSLDVPILFFLGRYDRHMDAGFAAAYLDNLHAPVKRLVWFENSAHNVPFEEPALFNATVVRELQEIGIQPANDKPASLTYFPFRILGAQDSSRQLLAARIDKL